MWRCQGFESEIELNSIELSAQYVNMYKQSLNRKNRHRIVNRQAGLMKQTEEIRKALQQLGQTIEGDVLVDKVQRMVYATDASVYQEEPIGIVRPRNDEDLRLLIELANRYSVGLIPRAAGTSLAGQVVGAGIVVDISRYMNAILEVNVEERWVRVQPGVIRDELNRELKKVGLLFGPETSTSNRAMIGGMLGNNSCGSNSIVYGTTRENTIQIGGFLSDGSRITLGCVSCEEDLQHPILQQTLELLSGDETQQAIRDRFPKAEVSRRNMGYAVDRLIDSDRFCGNGKPLNFSHLIAGSEGTLMFATDIKLKCEPLPPEEVGLFCPHFETLQQSLEAVQVIMRESSDQAGSIYACELIDQLVLEGASRNIAQQKNLEFVKGSPAAMLIVAIRASHRQDIETCSENIKASLQKQNLGYAYPLYYDEAVARIWELRKAGLGVVANIVGDAKPVTLIEDTAVAVEDLPRYIEEVDELLKTKYNAECVHYAHVGAGEVHLRPIINLKTAGGVRSFRGIGTDVSAIVKRYRGSISGEHGDGRLRAEFLRDFLGEQNYELLRQIKATWDPKNLFNPGKIIDAPAMDEQLRYRVGEAPPEMETQFDFSAQGGLLRAAEMCSGSGDCRKTELTGGVMCPSYMATRNEIDTTRARANVLRQVLTDPSESKALSDPRLKQVMDLCLACKGCKSECPSNVDMAKMKAEVLYRNLQDNGVPRRARFIANLASLNERAARVPWLSNRLMGGRFATRLLKKYLSIHPQRSLPTLSKQTLRRWFKRHQPHENAGKQGTVCFFCDEFTNFLDAPVGIAAIELLERLGYRVELPQHAESGRAAISQGLLDQGKACATQNVTLFDDLLGDEQVLIGVEPSALLTFRDEYPGLVDPQLREVAHRVGRKALLLDEFLSRLLDQQKVGAPLFTQSPMKIYLHGHCHQKALSSMRDTIRMLQLPSNYQVKLIPAGCCGMAGAFGFEDEHYEISMQVGELVLFPAIRELDTNQVIAAGGTSCRHQILDGTGRVALHPVQVLRQALGG
ncbi:MAG: FAD-linked oxidase C-terminal domain-containing protein [Pirellulaceae bacterium]|nr:FAD-linked oxidase C-terminal domain-containing protein [Pirellulaceae bacterium]